MKVRLLLPITSLLLAVALDVAGQTLTITPDLQGGRLRLQWPNRSNEVFQIQMRASLDHDDWEPLVYLSGDAPRLIWQDESETASITPTLQDNSAVPRTAIYSSFWTAAGIMGSPLDMARWTRALYRGEVLSSSSMKQMTNLVNATPFFSEFPRYGLGTMEISSSKGAFLGHAGDGFGYRCLVGHSPRLDANVLFVINTDTGWDLSGFVRMVDGWKALVAKL